MCDMYGHCLVNLGNGEVVRDYLRWNSHREILVPAQDAGYIPVGAISPSVAAWGLRYRAAQTGSVRRFLHAGIDPVDGGVECNDDAGDVLYLTPSQKERVRISWDYEIPSIEKMCEWFDAHFCKRRDEWDWIRRGPLLFSPSGRAKYDAMSRGEDVAEERFEDGPQGWSVSQFLDNFRKHPNEYWERSRHENRRDLAARVLELNTGCDNCTATVTFS